MTPLSQLHILKFRLEVKINLDFLQLKMKSFSRFCCASLIDTKKKKHFSYWLISSKIGFRLIFVTCLRSLPFQPWVSRSRLPQWFYRHIFTTRGLIKLHRMYPSCLTVLRGCSRGYNSPYWTIVMTIRPIKCP